MNARLAVHSLLVSLVLSAPAYGSAVVGKAPQDVPGSAQARGEAARGRTTDPGAYKPGQVIVRYRRGVKEEHRAEIRARAGVRRLKALALTGSELAEIAGGAGVENVVARLQANPGVLSAQPNFVYRASALPNDELFAELWGLDNVGQYIGGSHTNGVGTIDVDVDAPEAWEITRGDREIVVGVIDTAVDVDHPDLASNVWTNPGEIPGDGIDNDHNGFVDDVHGWNFFARTATTWKPGEHYHGTHVAGTIAAVAGNAIGVAGVAPNVRVVQLQFLGPDGFGYTSDAVDALGYAKSMGVRVTSNSWGGGSFDAELHDAICSFDGVFVAAAGNSSANADASPAYPAAYDCPNIVSVAALTNRGELAWFSNWGARSVDVGAPGVDVLSTLPAGQYGFLSGTSMATPHVAGIVALMLSVQPGLGGAEVRQLLIDTAKPLDSLRGLTVSGGLASAVNAVHALELVTDPRDGAIDVPADQVVTVTYFGEVQPGPAFDGISLLRGGAPVAATRTLAGRVLRIAPAAPLPIDGLYTVTIPADAVRDLAGRALRAYTFAFKTRDTIAPAAVRTDPPDGGTNVGGSRTIVVEFDEEVRGGPALAAITLSAGGVVAQITALTEGKLLKIDPVFSLAASSSYTVTVPAGAVTDLSGNPQAALAFGFGTAVDVTPPRVVSCRPAPYQQEVPTADDIVFDYTKNVTLAANAPGIFINCGLGGPGHFTASTSANVLVLHPVLPLPSSDLCLAMVPAGALQDEYGNTNAEPNGVYFWTRDDRAPLRTATSPADGATGVPARLDIVVTFDEDIFPGQSMSAVTLKDDSGASVPVSWRYTDDGNGFTYAYQVAFTPQDVLGSLRRYTLTVPAGALTDGSPQRNPAAAFQVSFTTEQDVVRPWVTTTDPVMRATEVPIGKTISVSFSEKVVPGSGYGSIVLKNGTAAVPAATALSGAVLTVTPAAPLLTDTSYTLELPSGAVADLAGNALAGYTLVFSTPDTLPPTVVGTAPAPGATDVAVGSSIFVTLSEGALPGPAFAGIALRDRAGTGIPVTSAFYEDEIGIVDTYLVVRPAAPMSPNSVYTLSLPAGAVTDAKGNPSAPHEFSFSTPYPVVASAPAAGATNVPLDAVVTLSLLAPGAPGPTFAGIALKRGTTAVAASVSLSGAVLTVRPSAALSANTAYTLAVPAGAVVSGAGVPLAAFALSFRTFDPDVPRVTWTDPANGATGVPPGAAVTVAFSESTVPGPGFGAIVLSDALGTPLPITADYWCDDEGCVAHVLVIIPSAPLAPASAYSVSLPAGALLDASGNASQPYAFGFTTQ